MRLITKKGQWMVLMKSMVFRRVLSRQIVIILENLPNLLIRFVMLNVYLPIDEIMDEPDFIQDIPAVPETLKHTQGCKRIQ